MLMLDLFAGLGGASQAMRDRGWRVITVDYDPAFGTDIVADLATWSYEGEKPDLLWLSPPCDEFARESMPWSKTGKPPDLTLVTACYRLVDEIQPRYWILENVRGAVPYLGPAKGDSWTFLPLGVFPGAWPAPAENEKEGELRE